jgi:hypothetical protein
MTTTNPFPNVIKYCVARKSSRDSNNNNSFSTIRDKADCNGKVLTCCGESVEKVKNELLNGSLPSSLSSSRSRNLSIDSSSFPAASVFSSSTSYATKGVKESTPFYYFIREGDFDLVWVNIFVFSLAHIIYFYGILNVKEVSWKTWVFANQVGNFAGFSIGCGAHRLWSHKAYDASLALRTFYAIGQTIAGQNCIYIWCRDHRVHHKFSDTDGDPHNTKRGYFFSHVGWLLRKKHPELKIRSKTLDFSDLLSDPVVKFQKQ